MKKHSVLILGLLLVPSLALAGNEPVSEMAFILRGWFVLKMLRQFV